MARVCYICGKKPSTGHNVSHSNKKTGRRWLPNLVKVKIKEGNRGKKVWVCTSCLHAGKVWQLQQR